MKIREEHEIKKKVEEELQRIKSLKPEVKKKSKEQEQKQKEKEKKELDPGVTTVEIVTSAGIIVGNIIKRKAIPKAVKSTLWNIHFTENNAKGECKVCSKEIKMTDFDAGHIIAVTNGGSDNLDNLMPVCSLCNKSMGVQNLNEFKKLYFEKEL